MTMTNVQEGDKLSVIIVNKYDIFTWSITLDILLIGFVPPFETFEVKLHKVSNHHFCYIYFSFLNDSKKKM